MKKLCSLLLALVMLLGCVGFAAGFDYTGVWVLTAFEYQGMTIDPGDIGLKMVLTFNADGTCIMDTGEDDVVYGQWEPMDNGILVDGEMLFRIVNGKLVIEVDGAKLIFTREGSAPEPKLPGDANGDGKVDENDALVVLEFGAGTTVEINVSNADVNQDSGLTIEDALLIFQYVAGWDVELK